MSKIHPLKQVLEEFTDSAIDLADFLTEDPEVFKQVLAEDGYISTTVENLIRYLDTLKLEVDYIIEQVEESLSKNKNT